MYAYIIWRHDISVSDVEKWECEYLCYTVGCMFVCMMIYTESWLSKTLFMRISVFRRQLLDDTVVDLYFQICKGKKLQTKIKHKKVYYIVLIHFFLLTRVDMLFCLDYNHFKKLENILLNSWKKKYGTPFKSELKVITFNEETFYILQLFNLHYLRLF